MIKVHIFSFFFGLLSFLVSNCLHMSAKKGLTAPFFFSAPSMLPTRGALFVVHIHAQRMHTYKGRGTQRRQLRSEVQTYTLTQNITPTQLTALTMNERLGEERV